MKTVLPCAIYTRKSSEEGLEQGFNSLDAQREACEGFILSQKEQGWKALPALYDDGGFSGGNTQCPALARLLDDIRARPVRIVIVYKVDRLTRLLADFANLVELFDTHGVSFVSVTQQFNTTSSMGRLTLNVLLSFAQFEREVIGERIRDKIAVSKRKGMRTGGWPKHQHFAQTRIAGSKFYLEAWGYSLSRSRSNRRTINIALRPWTNTRDRSTKRLHG